jgi:hypothetical protein
MESGTGFEAGLRQILGDRRLPAAMTAYAWGLSELYAGPPPAVPIMGDLGRFAIVAGLFSSPGPVTQAAILNRMGPDLAGRARVAAHLSALRESGAIEPEAGDRRARPVRPTPWLEGWMRRWLEAMIVPARAWWRERGPPPEPSRRVLASYLGQVLAANRSGLNAFTTVPGVWRMMSLAGGHLFLLELVLASGGAERIGQPLAFSRRAFAARYGVSRPHAVDLTAEAERLTWLTRGDDGHVELTPAFAHEARRWCAIHFELCNAALTGRLLEVMGYAAAAE